MEVNRKLIDLTIDLVFAENCEKEAVLPYCDVERLVCYDLDKLKNELKKKIKEVLTDEESGTNH